MKRLLLTLCLLPVVCAAAGISAKHEAFGVKPGTEQEKCLTCHEGSYEALGKKTRTLSPNPHASHMGRVQCDACHAWKETSRLMCSDCHSFPELEKGLNREN